MVRAVAIILKLVILFVCSPSRLLNSTPNIVHVYSQMLKRLLVAQLA